MYNKTQQMSIIQMLLFSAKKALKSSFQKLSIRGRSSTPYRLPWKSRRFPPTARRSCRSGTAAPRPSNQPSVPRSRRSRSRLRFPRSTPWRSPFWGRTSKGCPGPAAFRFPLVLAFCLFIKILEKKSCCFSSYASTDYLNRRAFTCVLRWWQWLFLMHKKLNHKQ